MDKYEALNKISKSIDVFRCKVDQYGNSPNTPATYSDLEQLGTQVYYVFLSIKEALEDIDQ